jgi:hypothetical protein
VISSVCTQLSRVALLAIFALLPQLAGATATSTKVVFDSFPTQGDGGWGLSTGEQVGQTTTISDSPIAITRFEVALEVWADLENINFPDTFDLKLHFFDVAGSPGATPTIPFWTQKLDNIGFDRTMPRDYWVEMIVAFDVPNIIVPGTFTWTIQPENFALNINGQILLHSADTAEIGGWDTLWVNDYGSWDANTAHPPSSGHPLAARITAAVPEPSSLWLAIAAITGGLWWRHAL